MVVKDRLVGESLNQQTFINLANIIAPDDLPSKLRYRISITKNISREVLEEDRGEVYYKMRSNPQKLLCDTFWDIVKETILTE